MARTCAIIALTCLISSGVVDAYRKKRTNTSMASSDSGYRLNLVHVKKDCGKDCTVLRDLCNGELPGHAECITRADAFDGGAHGDLPFVVINCNDQELDTIKGNHPEIEFSERDAAVSVGPHEFNTENLKEITKVPWGLDRIDSRDFSADTDEYYGAGLTPGRGAHIYVLDSGIYFKHKDFGDRIIPTADSVLAEGVFQECGINGLEDKGLSSAECANDRSGHGTHVAGTAAGKQFGVAKLATLHSVKVTTNSPIQRLSGMLATMYWIACCGERPAVATLQLESDWKQPESYRRAVAALEAAGVVVVLPAGDRRRGGPDDACNDILKDDGAITVGSIGKTFVRYHYHADYFSDTSNNGKCVDVLAPGIDIPTTSSYGEESIQKTSGTAIASAHVAGAAAVLWGRGTFTTAEDVKKEILGEAKATNRRRREARHERRRRNDPHRSLSGTKDKVLYVSGGTDQIHRRRNPTAHRRRRAIPTGEEQKQKEETDKTEATPRTTLGGKPIYGKEQTEGTWIINFKLPPDGFQYFESSYSETLAIDFCANLTGSAKCHFKGRPRWGGIPFVSMTATVQELEAIISRPSYNNMPPEVEFVEADVEISALAEQAVEEEPQEKMGAMPQPNGRRRRSLSWGLDRIDSMYTLDGAYMVPKSGGYRDYGDNFNKSSTIYILDTGVRTTHSDFGGRASAAIDVTSGCLVECTPGDAACAQDNNGHGTHVAAVSAGTKYGVAKSAQVRGVKVFDDSGKGMLSWTMAAIDWVSRTNEGLAVALLNFEGVGNSPSFQRAVDFANLVGYVTMVVPAGHGGGNACANYPSNAETKWMSGTIGAGTLSVAATSSADLLADYSNFGKCVDFLAPGSAILTASHDSDTGSLHTSGTTLAAAHVAGGAALLLASEQAINPDRVWVFLYLGSYYHQQIDLKEKHEGTKNFLINVRDHSDNPEIKEASKTCYTCQYSKSGCPCMKEWSYPYDGKSHKVTDYCANPYGDKNGPYCMTETKCTIRVRGQPPRRSNTDYCDDVPGRRLAGGWLDKPHVYEPGKDYGPPDMAEDKCEAPATEASNSVEPTPTTAPQDGTENPRPTPAPEEATGNQGPTPAPAVDEQPGTGATPDTKELAAKIKEEAKELEADTACLQKRLNGQPC